MALVVGHGGDLTEGMSLSTVFSGGVEERRGGMLEAPSADSCMERAAVGGGGDGDSGPEDEGLGRLFAFPWMSWRRDEGLAVFPWEKAESKWRRRRPR
jgi:hypothetical protein